VICRVCLEDIEEPTMKEIRYLDKLIDESGEGEGDDEDPSAGEAQPLILGRSSATGRRRLDVIA
jgi:hypothetical protein